MLNQWRSNEKENCMGGILWAASATDGRKIASCMLAAAPAWDGIAVANKRVYVSLQDGSVECFEE
jgi:hypothetical protein